MTTFNGDQPYELNFSMGCGGTDASPVEQQFGHACEMAQTLLASYTAPAADHAGYNLWFANLLPKMQAIYRYAFGPLPIVNGRPVYGGSNYGSIAWDANPNIGT